MPCEHYGFPCPTDRQQDEPAPPPPVPPPQPPPESPKPSKGPVAVTPGQVHSRDIGFPLGWEVSYGGYDITLNIGDWAVPVATNVLGSVACISQEELQDPASDLLWRPVACVSYGVMPIGPPAGMAANLGRAVSATGGSGLARAAQFGLRPYGQLRSVTQGTGLQAHHLIEKRFASLFGASPNRMLAIALTRTEHAMFTQAWRQAIPYGVGTANATRQQVLNAARQIYAAYPEILRALGL